MRRLKKLLSLMGLLIFIRIVNFPTVVYAFDSYGVIDDGFTMEAVASDDANTLDYWVYRPNNADEEDLPLIVYLHGTDGCAGDIDNVINIIGLPRDLALGDVSVNAVVVAPQIHNGESWGANASKVIDIIDLICMEGNINRQKISLTGFSLGGVGTFELAIRYPGLFSCLVPVAASVNPDSCIGLKMPIKIYHGSEDESMGYSIREAKKVINANGGHARLKMIEGAGHSIQYIYTEKVFGVLNWMIKQTNENNVYKILTPDSTIYGSGDSIGCVGVVP